MFHRAKEQSLDFIADGLWTEGVGLFFRYWRNWVRGAIGFVVAGYGARYFLSDQATGFGLVNLLLQIGQVYFFCVCFLQQEPITGAIKRDKKNTVTAFIFIIVQMGVVYAVLSLNLVTPLSDFAVYLVQSYVAVIVLFLAPLAVNNFDKIMPLNLTLVGRNFLRLWVNWLMVQLLFAPYFIFVYIFYERAGGVQVNPVISVLNVGIMSALACAACKILYGEHMARRFGDRRGATRG